MEFLLGRTLGIISVCFVVSWLAKKYLSPARAAAKMKKNNDKLYAADHEYRIANPENFPNLDHHFYYSTRKEFESLDFKFIEHIEDVTINKAKVCGVSTYISTMTGCNGKVIAAFYDPHPSFVMRLLMYIAGIRIHPCIDLETYFSNGDILGTSNAEAAGNVSLPPQIMTKYERAGTHAGELLRIHLQRLNSYVNAHPETETETVESYDRIIEKQNYMNRLKSEFRKKVGTVTREEMSRMAGPGTGLFVTADKVYEEVRKLEKEEQN